MMENVSKENMYGLEIYDYNGEGFKPAVRFEGWRVAYLNHCEHFMEENFKTMSRHNETDEVFVLLTGKATLIIGEDRNKVEMEPHKCYNVPKGVWHAIFTSEGTSVLIVESNDTGDHNSDFLDVNK